MTSMHIQFLSNTSMIHNLQSRSQHPIAIFKWVMLGSWGILRGPVARICILEGCSVSSLMNLTLLTRTFSALPIFKADFYLNRRNGINNLALYQYTTAVGFASLSWDHLTIATCHEIKSRPSRQGDSNLLRHYVSGQCLGGELNGSPR